MNVQPSDSRNKYQSAQQQQAPTGGFLPGKLGNNAFLVGFDTETNILADDYNEYASVFEPSPLAAGPAHGGCSPGYATVGFNILLHLVTAIITIIAAAAHLQLERITLEFGLTHLASYGTVNRNEEAAGDGLLYGGPDDSGKGGGRAAHIE